ncbi:MAG: hypothetical protein CMJ31_14285 [Phycisphaerae bacterium]|nr:hypothetical protein [Phycisphaerae bacterium]
MSRVRTHAIALAAIGLLALSLAPGCVVGALVGGMAESAHQAGSTMIPAAYAGVEGKSYAVVVSADRSIQAEHPGLVEHLTQRVDRLISENAGASGHVPAQTVLSKLYNNVGWIALGRGELGERLGVERLIVLELNEYRLHEPGNRYTWEGVATGIVQVYEIDSGLPDEPLYEQAIRVAFPDQMGILREQLGQSVVTSALSQRLSNRMAWLFFDHEEPNAIEY